MTDHEGTWQQGVDVDRLNVGPARAAAWGSAGEEFRIILQGSGRGPICGAESFLGQE